jgi:hypothetical protein
MQETFVPLHLPAGALNESIEIDTSDLEIPDEYQGYRPLLAGLVLDISPQHHPDSRRYIDIIKAQLVEAIRPLEETEDRVYIFNPNRYDIPDYQGKAIALLMEYKMPPIFSDVEAINCTLALIGHENHSHRKKFVYITDRNRGAHWIGMEIALGQNRTKDYRCDLYLIGIGDKYNPSLLELPLTAHHLDDPYQLAAKMTEVFGAAS